MLSVQEGVQFLKIGHVACGAGVQSIVEEGGGLSRGEALAEVKDAYLWPDARQAEPRDGVANRLGAEGVGRSVVAKNWCVRLWWR